MFADSATCEMTASGRDYRLIHDVYVVLDAIDHCVLTDFDLTNSQYRLLTLLSAEQGQRLTDLSDAMLFHRSTITRLIDSLEAKGLVCRVAHSDDRRAQQVGLTAAGLEVRERARTAHETSLVERLATLSPDDQVQLGDLLEKMRLSLRADLERRESSGANGSHPHRLKE